MITGSNRIEEYSSVQAYAVAPQNSGIISGGTGDVTVNEGMTFLWVYDPNGTSGFTGVGWFADVPNSPLDYASKTAEQINQEFASGTRRNLDDIFTNWQTLVNSGSGIASDFAKYLTMSNAAACWTT